MSLDDIYAVLDSLSPIRWTGPFFDKLTVATDPKRSAVSELNGLVVVGILPVASGRSTSRSPPRPSLQNSGRASGPIAMFWPWLDTIC